MRILVRVVRTLPAAVLCALAAHAAVYRSFWPSDGVHGYFGWYEPAVGAASLASVIGLIAFLLFARLARSCGRSLRVTPALAPVPLARRVRSLAASAVVLLVVQETLERSVPAGRLVVASFWPSQWLTLLASAALAALVLVLALRLAEVAVRAVLRPARVLGLACGSGGWSVVCGRVVRLRPLAVCCGLRAPPLLGV